MKTKTINAILCKKFDTFLESITDPALKELVRGGTIITGGCIVSMLQKENVNDYDLYFRNQETALAVASYYAKVFTASNLQYEVDAKLDGYRVTISVNKSKNVSVAGEAPEAQDDAPPESFQESVEQADNLDAAKLEGGKEEPKTPKYHPIFLSSNAITLSTKVQLIVRFYGEPNEIHDNYDFVHCTNYWTSWERKVTLRAEALEAILTKELRYTGSRYPICSIIRTRKFLSRGWTINAGQYVKMCWQVSNLDLTDIEVLKDQLVGVDSAYFNQVNFELKKKQKDSPEAACIDGTYLMTLIDKIF